MNNPTVTHNSQQLNSKKLLQLQLLKLEQLNGVDGGLTKPNSAGTYYAGSVTVSSDD